MSWEHRVAYPSSGAYAFRPNQVLVRPLAGQLPRAREILARVRDGLPLDPVQGRDDPAPDDLPDPSGEALFDFVRFVFERPVDVVLAVSALTSAGIYAQPNHVLFADNFSGNNFSGNPFSGNPFSGNPFSGNPFSGNPFSGNPFSGNPFAGNGAPEITYGKPHLVRDRDFATTGEGPCLARPIDLPDWLAGSPNTAADGPLIAVLDVPLPDDTLRPPLLQGMQNHGAPGLPFASYDATTNRVGFLDRVAGHGMFVAGRVLSGDPAATVSVHAALTNDGDGEEWVVMGLLKDLAGQVDIVNLSFGAYALDDMAGLRAAVTGVQTTWRRTSKAQSSAPEDQRGAVVVTSAGNDSTSLVPYPAAFDGVVSVAALGPNGAAAFTNFGPWVRACASGVEVPSAYFADFDGSMHPEPVRDPDAYCGAATWSGTSFAAPLVAGKLSRMVRQLGLAPKQAVAQLLDDPGPARFPGLGTVVTP